MLLRSLGGYVTAPRTTMVANASVFDRILVMPVTAPAPSPASAAALPPPPPFAAFQPQQFQPPPQDDDRDDGPPQMPQPPGNRGPVFVFPPPAGGEVAATANNRQPARSCRREAAGASYPGAPTTTAPVGVSVPGMIVPAPAAAQLRRDSPCSPVSRRLPHRSLARSFERGRSTVILWRHRSCLAPTAVREASRRFDRFNHPISPGSGEDPFSWR